MGGVKRIFVQSSEAYCQEQITLQTNTGFTATAHDRAHSLICFTLYDAEGLTYNVQLGKNSLQRHVLHVCGEAFVEPQVIPPPHRYQVPKPLQVIITDRLGAASLYLLLSHTNRQTQLPDERAHAR